MGTRPEYLSEEWFEALFADLEKIAARVDGVSPTEDGKVGTGVLLHHLSKEDGGGWLASTPALPGCIAHGESEPAAVQKLIDAARNWEQPSKNYPWSLHAPLAMWKKQNGLIGKRTYQQPAKLWKPQGNAKTRGLEEYLKNYKKAWEKCPHGSRWDWEGFERDAHSKYHFSPLSDDEWHVVLGTIKSANPSEFKDGQIRELIDWTAQYSGHFKGFSYYSGETTVGIKIRISECKKLIASLTKTLMLTIEFLGPEIQGTDEYDPHKGFRDIDIKLTEFLLHAQSEYQSLLRLHKSAKAPRANKRKHLDIETWLAGLIRIWEEKLGFPLANTAKLQRFMLACLKPYGLGFETEKMAKDFITKVINGEIPKAEPLLIEKLQDE